MWLRLSLTWVAKGFLLIHPDRCLSEAPQDVPTCWSGTSGKQQEQKARRPTTTTKCLMGVGDWGPGVPCTAVGVCGLAWLNHHLHEAFMLLYLYRALPNGHTTCTLPCGL